MAILTPQPIAIIPARGGSKRIPHKNIKDFLGSPLISYSIKTAKRSELFRRVIVSTDSAAIARIAKEYGAEVPFVRNAILSDDFTPTLEVIADAINQCKISDETPICCIYPTAPLLSPSTLQKAYKLLTPNTAYVFSATPFDFTPFRSFSYANQSLEMLYPQYQNTRSQDLPELYHDAGQFYLGLAKTFKAQVPIFSPASQPLFLHRMQVQDIDTLEDLKLAELKYKFLYEN